MKRLLVFIVCVFLVACGAENESSMTVAEESLRHVEQTNYEKVEGISTVTADGKQFTLPLTTKEFIGLGFKRNFSQKPVVSGVDGRVDGYYSVEGHDTSSFVAVHMSPTGEKVDLDESVICAFSADTSACDGIEVEFYGGLTFNSTDEDVRKVCEDMGDGFYRLESDGVRIDVVTYDGKVVSMSLYVEKY